MPYTHLLTPIDQFAFACTLRARRISTATGVMAFEN